MPRGSSPRRTLEDLEAAAESVRPVQDRLVYAIAVDEIRPAARNPRHKLEGLDELAASIREFGLLQPVVVRRADSGYELIPWPSPVCSCTDTRWTQVPAVVRDETDEQAYLLTLTENLQRDDLCPREEAGVLEVLVRERGWTTRQVG